LNGAGLLQFRVRVIIPSPQLREQLPSFQALQTPSEEFNDVKMKFENYFKIKKKYFFGVSLDQF